LNTKLELRAITSSSWIFDSVGEIFLLRVAAHVLERQDGERGLVRQRRGLGKSRGRRVRRVGRRAGHVSPDRAFDIPDLLSAEVGECQRQYLFDLLVGRARYADAAGLGQRLQARRDVDGVAKQVAAADHHVAHMDADTEVDPLVGGDAGVRLAERRLRLDRALHGVDGTCELRENAVAGRVRDAASMLGNGPTSSAPMRRL